MLPTQPDQIFDQNQRNNVIKLCKILQDSCHITRNSAPFLPPPQAASNDKRFVVEAAEAALSALASSSPALLRTLAAPYCARHKNPRVRGKAAPLLAAGVRGSEPGEM